MRDVPRPPRSLVHKARPSLEVRGTHDPQTVKWEERQKSAGKGIGESGPAYAAPPAPPGGTDGYIRRPGGAPPAALWPFTASGLRLLQPAVSSFRLVSFSQPPGSLADRFSRAWPRSLFLCEGGSSGSLLVTCGRHLSSLLSTEKKKRKKRKILPGFSF